MQTARIQLKILKEGVKAGVGTSNLQGASMPASLNQVVFEPGWDPQRPLTAIIQNFLYKVYSIRKAFGGNEHFNHSRAYVPPNPNHDVSNHVESHNAH